MRIKEESIQKKYDNIKMYIEELRNNKLKEICKKINLILNGYYNYYGINTNIEWLTGFHRYAQKEILKLYMERYGVPQNEQDMQYLEYIINTIPLAKPKILIYL